MSSKDFENQGLDLWKKGDAKNAKKFFDKANEAYPMYSTTPSSSGNVDMDAMQKKWSRNSRKKWKTHKKMVLT